MTIVAGFAPGSQAGAAPALAGRIAARTGEPVVLCLVLHDAWRGAGGMVPEDGPGLDPGSEEALTTARAAVPDGVAVETVVSVASSVPHALLEEGKRREASLLVVGSSTAGPFGHITLGSTTNRLVHGAGIPVALAPRGYRATESGVGRLVLAASPSGHDDVLAAPVSALAARVGARVAVVTFAVSTPQVSAIGGSVDRALYDTWRDQIRASQDRVVDAVESSAGGDGSAAGGDGLVAGEPQLVVGRRWADAVDGFAWEADDLLVLGSSEHGPLGSVFLGSNGTRLMRHAPVPVVLVPRR